MLVGVPEFRKDAAELARLPRYARAPFWQRTPAYYATRQNRARCFSGSGDAYAGAGATPAIAVLFAG